MILKENFYDYIGYDYYKNKLLCSTNFRYCRQHLKKKHLFIDIIKFVERNKKYIEDPSITIYFNGTQVNCWPLKDEILL